MRETAVYNVRRRTLMLTAAALTLPVIAGCASGPKPVIARITLEASAGVNPDQRGRPSPVAVKLFELKSLASFERADFFSLFDRERETLGSELVGRDELVMKPGDHVSQERKLSPEVRFIGVLVGFRDLERSQWRLAIPIDPKRTQPIVVQLEPMRVALK
jgi:type VI secretion system protein VasD